MMVNRGRLEIMAHILTLCIEPKVKTRIMYDVNITFSQFRSYAALLESQGLIANQESKYVTTAKGLRFVNAFIKLQSVLGTSDLKISTPTRLVKARQEPKTPPSTFYV